MYFKDITIYIVQKSKGGKGRGHGAKTPREPKEPREPVNEKGYKVRGYVKGQTCNLSICVFILVLRRTM